MKKRFLVIPAFLICMAASFTMLSAQDDMVDPTEAEGITSVTVVKSDDSKSDDTTASEETIKIAEKEEEKKKDEKKDEKKDDDKKDEKKDDKKDDDKKDEKDSNEETYSPSITGTVQVGSSYLNVRTGEWGTIVGSLYTGDQVTITGRKGDWYIAEINGQTRYIHMNYVDTPKKKSGCTPVKYPWESGVTTGSNEIVISQEAIDSCGWGSVYPQTPPAVYISSPYGYRTHPVTGQAQSFHNGVDLPCETGRRLNALANGTVVSYSYDNGGGNMLKIRYDNGYESSYLHMQSACVKAGDKVQVGQQVGVADNTGIYTTGSHLHFTVRYNGETVDPAKTGVPLIKK